MKIDNFFAELKRRNVYKVAVAYIVAGWALSQGIAQVFPVFDVPNWAIRLDCRSYHPRFSGRCRFSRGCLKSLRRESSAPKLPMRCRATTGQKKHAWIYIVVIGALFSIGLFFLGRYIAPGTAATASNEVAAKSIAVLPFDNLSATRITPILPKACRTKS